MNCRTALTSCCCLAGEIPPPNILRLATTKQCSFTELPAAGRPLDLLAPRADDGELVPPAPVRALRSVSVCALKREKTLDRSDKVPVSFQSTSLEHQGMVSSSTTSGARVRKTPKLVFCQVTRWSILIVIL